MLRQLIVGKSGASNSELASITRELSIRLLHLGAAGWRLRKAPEKSRDISLYGPYIGRAYLETAATAFIARMDPVRVLVAKKHQDAPYYEEASRSKSAIQWSGDILSKKKPSTTEFWSIDPREEGCRALLGPWVEELIWRPAFDRFCDAISTHAPVDDWTLDLSNKQPDSFCKEIRASLDGLFSKFSKGVHSELLGNPKSMFDAVSIDADFQALTKLLTGLALLTHFSEHFSYRLDIHSAIEIANKIGRHWK